MQPLPQAHTSASVSQPSSNPFASNRAFQRQTYASEWRTLFSVFVHVQRCSHRSALANLFCILFQLPHKPPPTCTLLSQPLRRRRCLELRRWVLSWGRSARLLVAHEWLTTRGCHLPERQQIAWINRDYRLNFLPLRSTSCSWCQVTTWQVSLLSFSRWSLPAAISFKNYQSPISSETYRKLVIAVN